MSPKALLLLDDDASVRMTMAALLEDAGFAVTDCATWAEAEIQIARRTFDGYIVDFELGAVTAAEVVPKILKIRSDARIALFSGGGSGGGVAGIELTLVKGGRPASIIGEIERWMATL